MEEPTKQPPKQQEQTKLDETRMRLAIAEAKKSDASPNAYCVGCVVVDNATGQVLATGFSRERPGNTHAEQVALMKLDFDAINTTLYTTMEPCSHRLSGNMPCAENCIRAGVARVVIGVLEPKNFVEKCQGVQLLQAAGIQVDVLQGLERECLEPNQHLNLVL